LLLVVIRSRPASLLTRGGVSAARHPRVSSAMPTCRSQPVTQSGFPPFRSRWTRAVRPVSWIPGGPRWHRGPGFR